MSLVSLMFWPSDGIMVVRQLIEERRACVCSNRFKDEKATQKYFRKKITFPGQLYQQSPYDECKRLLTRFASLPYTTWKEEERKTYNPQSLNRDYMQNKLHLIYFGDQGNLIIPLPKPNYHRVYNLPVMVILIFHIYMAFLNLQ